MGFVVVRLSMSIPVSCLAETVPEAEPLALPPAE
jgi:hypothetical protein